MKWMFESCGHDPKSIERFPRYNCFMRTDKGYPTDPTVSNSNKKGGNKPIKIISI